MEEKKTLTYKELAEWREQQKETDERLTKKLDQLNENSERSEQQHRQSRGTVFSGRVFKEKGIRRRKIRQTY